MGGTQSNPKNIALRSAAVLLCLFLVSLCMLSAALARYTSADSGKDGARAASVIFDVKDSSGSRLDLSQKLKLDNLRPSESTTLTFAICNDRDGRISETAMEYTIIIKTTGNLPLTYTLSPVSGSSGNVTQDGANLSWSGGSMPAAQVATHNYQLTVTWPADKNDISYLDEVDSVYLVIEAKQNAS